VTEALGDDRVLLLARRTRFGPAVDAAARTAGVLTPDDLPYLKRPSGWTNPASCGQCRLSSGRATSSVTRPP
ncbi:hypothetical protein, partial [Streptomyces sp. BE147]|uniref:hypothetical protein n=1 Tax=Streptomyces sp. BE147 TaxID=3002524 RepID=UPI003FA7EC00